jgi:hypothetical protein
MAKIRVHEIAKELGVPAKVVLAWLATEGEEARSAAVLLKRDVADRVRTSLGTPTVGNLATELNVPALVLIDYLRIHGADYTDHDCRLTPEMAQRLRLEFRPKKLVPLPEDSDRKQPIDAGKVLWCPLCDWRASDSMTTRQRMGLHLADEHYSEIAFPPGKEPDDLEPT